MANKGRFILILSFLAALSASVCLTFPLSEQLPQKPQTEIVAQGYEMTTDETVASEAVASQSVLHSKRRYQILLWHNHTINLHLRNVRSKWLASSEDPYYLPITYPEDDLI